MTGELIISRINQAGSGDIQHHRIANTFRRMYIPGASFAQTNPAPAVAGNPDGSVARVNKVWGVALTPSVNNDAVSAVFMVPVDFVSALPAGNFPKLRIVWGTDSTQTGADRKTHLKVSFDKASSITGAASPVTLRYTLRANAVAGSNNEMECPIPPAGGIIETPIYESGDFWAGTPGVLNAGDYLVITITRVRDADDPNTGNIILYGVAYDYFGDI